MSKTNNGGSAFPSAERRIKEYYDGTTSEDYVYEDGMTLRQYAAIKLRVPDSGTDWLDDMIRKSLRDEFAAKAMTGVLADTTFHADPEEIAHLSLELADNMLKAREA
jgi:hypothetical protein